MDLAQYYIKFYISFTLKKNHVEIIGMYIFQRKRKLCVTHS